MTIRTVCCDGLAAVAIAAGLASMAWTADARGGSTGFDAAKCGGFAAADAAPFLGVAAAQVVAHLEPVSKSLAICSFAAGKALPGVTFSIETEPTAEKAAAALERYRENLELAAVTPAWKGKLPKGAYSDIGLGDEAVWSDINGVLMVRKARRCVQVTMPKSKTEQIKLAQAILGKM